MSHLASIHSRHICLRIDFEVILSGRLRMTVTGYTEVNPVVVRHLTCIPTRSFSQLSFIFNEHGDSRRRSYWQPHATTVGRKVPRKQWFLSMLTMEDQFVSAFPDVCESSLFVCGERGQETQWKDPKKGHRICI